MTMSASFKYFLCFIFLAIFCSFSASACTLNMVYKDGGKEPLIKKKPKHDGVYFDLFSKAAQKIGCKLKVSRLPKKRLHDMLKKGSLDFYPGASFSKKRAKYLFYTPNGLDTGEYGITNTAINNLSSYDDLKSYNATWLMEIGSSKQDRANSLGIKTQDRKHFDLDFVSKYINRSKDKNYFYVADKEIVDYYPQKSGKSLSDAGLKVHKDCCGGDQPMYMGFSRFSANFKEVPNPSYKKSMAISPDNFPTMLDKSSVVYKLAMALSGMRTDGTTSSIYKKWFSN